MEEDRVRHSARLEFQSYHGYDMDSKGDRINRHKLKRAFLMQLP